MDQLPTNRELARTVEAVSTSTAMSIRRHRRWIAVNALIEVFHIGTQRGLIPGFIVKGGFALEFRFRNEARASRDVDVVVALNADNILDAVIEVLRIDWSGFTFAIKDTPERREHSYRLQITAQYQRREWSTFELELVFAEITGHDVVAPLDLAAYGLLMPTGIPCMTIAEQVAQKLHAVTDPREDRPRDLIDIYLCVTRIPPGHAELREVCVRTFAERATHAWPPNIEVHDEWPTALAALIADSDLELTVEEVVEGVRTLVVRLTADAAAEVPAPPVASDA
jgi:hypothetical protein